MNSQFLLAMLLVAGTPCFCAAQFGGSLGGSYAHTERGGKERAEQSEIALRTLETNELPPTATSMFVEARILLNAKADEYVVVFGIAQEGKTLDECNKKMDATLESFTGELKKLKIADESVSVDFILQQKIYGFQMEEGIFQEKHEGFELKKNISIRYQDPAIIDKITLAAAKAGVFDLIKVDYILKDQRGIQDKLLEEAARVTKHKLSRYEKLLGVKVVSPPQIYAERTAMHFPTQLYDSFKAEESEEFNYYQSKYTIRSLRKSKTFVFNGLDGSGFDTVIDPVITQPVVQCTLYLKVKYEMGK